MHEDKGQFFDTAKLTQVKAKLTEETLLLDTYAPYLEHRIIERANLARDYEAAGAVRSPVFSVGDSDEGQLLLVTVGDDYSTAIMMNGDTWYYLALSPDEELIEVDFGGHGSLVPRGAILPRETGLELLERSADWDTLVAAYPWQEQGG